jgi:hypothetical protein
MWITINGEQVDGGDTVTIAYEMVLALARMHGTPSMTYRFPGGLGGILTPGDRVALVRGLIFNVVHTGNA